MEIQNTNQKQSNKTIWILISVVVILLAILLFVFVAKPQFENYIVGKQIVAQQDLRGFMIQQLNSQGYVTITDAINQSVVLVPAQQQ